MSFQTVEVEIDHGDILPKAALLQIVARDLGQSFPGVDSDPAV